MQKNKIAKIVVIVGPTASGKSNLAIKIARKFNGEIISADSRQVYRRLDIGTGKVPKDRPNNSGETRYYSSKIRHHLVDVANPKKQFTADDFKKLGEKALKEILAKGKIPVIVGGTGFYIDVLLDRMLIADVPPNQKLRARFDKLTVEHLFKTLKKLDPRRAKTVDPKNKRRLIRALEIILTTGKPVPKLNHESRIMNYDVLWLGLKPKNLEKLIKQRLDKRLQMRMIREVKKLRRQGVSWKRLDDLGLEYRWISRYLIQKSKVKSQNYKLKLKSFKKSEHYDRLLREIIKYSKRQMTWFKRNSEIKWIKSQTEADKLLQFFL